MLLYDCKGFIMVSRHYRFRNKSFVYSKVSPWAVDVRPAITWTKSALPTLAPPQTWCQVSELRKSSISVSEMLSIASLAESVRLTLCKTLSFSASRTALPT